MKLRTLLLAGGLLVAATASAAEWKNALAPEGMPIPWKHISTETPGYTILLPQTPTSQELYTANLLSDAIKKMTGAVWPMLREPALPQGNFVSLGSTQQARTLGSEAKLKPDGYQIREHQGNWYFDGGRRRGPINAVLAWLEEDLGWRDYSIFLPQHFPDWRGKALQAVPRAYNPPWDSREVLIQEAWNPHWTVLNRTTPMLDPTGQQISNEVGGTAFYPEGCWFAHTFERLIKDEDFKNHPEYFAEFDGNRSRVNICLSNPEIVKIVANKIIAVLDKRPEAAFIGISPNDGENQICQCKECKALCLAEESKAAPLLRFVNKAAALIADKYPKVKIETLAYLEYAKPPKTIRPANNVLINLATDSHSWENPYHFVEETDTFQQILRAWNETGTEIYLWDYTFADNSHWMNPAPNFDVIAHNLRFYQQYKKVNGILLQDAYCSVNSSRGAMKNWILSKLLWNPQWDLKSLERDFCYGYYGAAGEDMQAYNELLRNEWQRYHKAYRPARNRSFSPQDGKKLTVSAEFTPQALRLLEQAAATVANHPALSREVDREMTCLLYQRVQKGVRSPEYRAVYLADITKLREKCTLLNITSFGENTALENQFTSWTLSAERPPVKLPTPNTLQFWLDTVWMPNTLGRESPLLVKDPDAEAGCAVLQPAAALRPEWSVQWQFRPEALTGFRSGRYVIRMRAKLGSLVRPSGSVVELGLYSNVRATLIGKKVFSVADFKNKGYNWLEIPGVSIPRESGCLYVMPAVNSAAKGIYLDLVEFIPEDELREK
jgi:hypothetical protein